MGFVFLDPAKTEAAEVMESPFDIAADLDTPVSAYVKLKPFKPCFLLESVENGERLARYSFLGLGARVTLELFPDRLAINGKSENKPTNAAEWLAMMRDALDRAPSLQPEIEGVPFNGGLVGTTGYDVVRFFEKLPPNRDERKGLVQAAYVAPESLLVFDHLTRRVALLHAGTERERQTLRTEIMKALRGGLDAPGKPGTFSRAEASMTEAEHAAAVVKGKAHIKAGDIYQLVLSVRFAGRHRPRSVSGLPRAAADESLALHVLLRARRPARRGLLARGAGALVRPNGVAAADRGHAAARNDGRADLAHERSCSPTRRKTPST